MNTVKTQADLVLENNSFRLLVGADCRAKSLVHKATGQECLVTDQAIALFSVTQARPYNNEIKLAHPNKETSFQANRIRREGKRLIVGFELTPYSAVLELSEKADYLAFTLVDFIVGPDDYGHLNMDAPPVLELRLLQLPVKDRQNFGAWLNVSFDEEVAVNVLAPMPQTKIDSQKRPGWRLMTADAKKDIQLLGCQAALIVSSTDLLLDVIAGLEEDFGLPAGVKSRRNPIINRSSYWTSTINLANVDEHLAYAKKGGFSCMLIYYPAIFKEKGSYRYNGNYDYNEHFPNGQADLVQLLAKIKAAGITPGFHFLHSHIGVESRYVTPVADHRLNLKKHFTLARPLKKDDTILYVEEDPTGSPLADRCRILKFAGELIAYSGFTKEPPYTFTGLTRAEYGTGQLDHALGLIGGILDVSEFGGGSVHANQNSSLQDEVAEKIAAAYDTGFEFIYFDGSEATNAPFEYHVPNAQYRVLKKLATQPLFTEGAAKAHFSWHHLSGGNAFDIFAPEIFKDMIRKYPCEQAPRMRQDFTRLNFGWWGFWAPGTQADMYEFGTSRAAAWDCPVTMMEKMADFKAHPRTDDILEVLRRWEKVRQTNWLTDAHKQELQNLDQEHTLLINQAGQFELVPYDQIKGAAGGSDILAFGFRRQGESYLVFWHASGSGMLELDLPRDKVRLLAEIDGAALDFTGDSKTCRLPVAGRQYLASSLPLADLVAAMQKARLL